MKAFDFSKSSMLHAGEHGLRYMRILAMALTAAVVPHYASAQPVISYVNQTRIQENTDDTINAERQHALEEAESDFRARGGRSERNFQASINRVDAAEKERQARMGEFRKSMESAAEAYGIGTCFGNQVSYLRSDVRRNAEESTVGIIISYNNIPVSQGSGFVVANSSVEGRGNRIVTASHVIAPGDLLVMWQEHVSGLSESLSRKYPGVSAKEALEKARHESGGFSVLPDKSYSASLDDYARYLDAVEHPDKFRITVYSSTGLQLGDFRTVSAGRDLNQPMQVDESVTLPVAGVMTEKLIVNRNPDDWAALEAIPGKIRLQYALIPGMKLAPVQMNEKTMGMSGGKTASGKLPGLSSGFSGGPVFDDEGKVYGVVSVAAYISANVSVRHMKKVLPVMPKDEVVLGMSQMTGINPVGEPALIAALGNAGQGIVRSGSSPMQDSRLNVLGNPGGYCAGSVTRQGRISAGSISYLPENSEGRMLPGMTAPPAPDSEFIDRSGNRHHFNEFGRRDLTVKPNGDTVTYDHETVVRIDAKDGSWTEFEEGRISLKGMSDGTIVGYDTVKVGGKNVDMPVIRISPDGEVTALLPQGRTHRMYPAPRSADVVPGR